MEIRPARLEDAEAIAKVHVDTWRTTYAGIVPDEFLAQLSQERSARMWRRALQDEERQGCLFVAEEAQAGVIGFVSGGPLREEVPGHPVYEGEIYAIYVLAAHRGKGAGSRLMERAFRWLAEHGLASVVVWVLKENPSRGFYQALGGVPIAEQEITIGDAPLLEVAYAWPSAAAAARKLSGRSDAGLAP